MPDERSYALCAYCPNLCRYACPVTEGSGHEATTPTAMMLGPLLYLRGLESGEVALAQARLCVSCGACTAVCRLERPVADLLRAARADLAPRVEPEPLIIDGEADLVVVESDARPWRDALARKLGVGVAGCVTRDHLGAHVLDDPERAERHLRRVALAFGTRTAVVSDAAVLAVLRAAGVRVQHLSALVAIPADVKVHHPCAGPRLPGSPAGPTIACCGGADPVATHHPAFARAMAERVRADLGDVALATPDARCRGALRAVGMAVVDPIDLLLTEDGWRGSRDIGT